ncbi:hypothetical protein J7J24_02680 [bacterium]|nr:hypothetical protein [bacterium]
MRKYVSVVDEAGQRMIFEKLPYRSGYAFYADLSQISFCPYCASDKIERHSPVKCRSCGETIGTQTKDGRLRVKGFPFRNWEFSPATGKKVVRVRTSKSPPPGP